MLDPMPGDDVPIASPEKCRSEEPKFEHSATGIIDLLFPERWPRRGMRVQEGSSARYPREIVALPAHQDRIAAEQRHLTGWNVPGEQQPRVACAIVAKGKQACMVTYPDRIALGLAFVRIQEHYESESKRFRGKYFSMPSYEAWWTRKHGHGTFDYPRVWSGYNDPGSSVASWEALFRKHEPRLRDEEESLLSKLHAASGKSVLDDSTYVIGITRKNARKQDDVFYHELSHAMFRLDPAYKERAIGVVRSLPGENIKRRDAVMASEGYTPGVFDDEIAAQEASVAGSPLHRLLEPVASRLQRVF